jgi:uncharacterized protein (UPF0332 family)
MFYAAQALLKSDGIRVTKHSAVESAFGEQFARTRRLDPGLHKKFIQARKAREVADYVVPRRLDAAVAAGKIEDAKEFLAAVEALLGPP